MNAIPSACFSRSLFPSTPAALLALTCLLSSSRISLSLQRAGTGRKAGLKVPMVCAHSPFAGCAGSSFAAPPASLSAAAVVVLAVLGEEGGVCVAQ